jgi:Flp pilus assembly protein TadB
MSCQRCGAEIPARGPRAPKGATKTWCKACEGLYDGWVRRHATDVVWQALLAGVVVAVMGLGLPLLGVDSLIAASGAFAGFGTLYGLNRATRRKRRQQFLQTALPRAYLPAPK